MGKLILIGIAGQKGNGKDTLGNILHARWGFTRTAFADPLKETVMKLWGFSYEQVYGNLKEIVDPRWGFSPRFALQKLGTEGVRSIHPETWTRSCMGTMHAARKGQHPAIHDPEIKGFRAFDPEQDNQDRWAVTDVRLGNEAQTIRDNGGIIIKVIRPGMLSTDEHISETNVPLLQADHTIRNDGTLKDLEGKLEIILGTIL